MKTILECVPNFSEGRKRQVIEELITAIEAGNEAAVLGAHMDADHNRTVITFAGEPEEMIDAAVRVVARAAELIDLRTHKGVHPRLGATDVLPFVPVSNLTVEDCVKLAHKAGERIAHELGLPVYFYERAALRPERRQLELVRGKGYEQLRLDVGKNASAQPDLGPPHLHETAGAVIIGARPFLIAYNVNLRSNNLSVAREIARKVRARDGGLPALKALGLALATRGIVQVSMNMIDYERTSMQQAFEAVEREALALGVEIESSEIVGLVPRAALPDNAAAALRIENFSEDLILENRLAKASAQSKHFDF